MSNTDTERCLQCAITGEKHKGKSSPSLFDTSIFCCNLLLKRASSTSEHLLRIHEHTEKALLSLVLWVCRAQEADPIRLCTCFPHVCILLPLRVTPLKSSSKSAFFRVCLLQPGSLKQPANSSRLSRGIKATKQCFKLTGMA